MGDRSIANEQMIRKKEFLFLFDARLEREREKENNLNEQFSFSPPYFDNHRRKFNQLTKKDLSVFRQGHREFFPQRKIFFAYLSKYLLESIDRP